MEVFRRWRGRVSALLVMGLAAAVVAAGCGGDDDKTQAGPTTAQAEKAASARVMYLSLAPVTAGNWEPLNYSGFTKSMEKYGLKFSKQQLTFDQAASVLRRVAPDNDLVVMDSSGFEGPLLEVAPEFPDTKFAVVSDLATTGDLPNVSGWAFNWSEYGYLAGTVACALAGEGGKIGHVNSVPIPAFTRWAGGAKAAAADQCGSTSDYLVSWTNSFEDPAKAKQAGLSLIARGAEALFSAADTADDGTREAVRERSKKYIGAYEDEHGKLPCCTVTSIVINFDRAYDQIGRDFLNDDFGKITPLNVANEGIRLATPFKNAEPEVQAKAEAVLEQIKNGEIKVDPKATVEP